MSDHNDKDKTHDEPETDALEQEETEMTSEESEVSAADDDTAEESDDAVSDEDEASDDEASDDEASDDEASDDEASDDDEASEELAASAASNEEPVAETKAAAPVAAAHDDHGTHGHGDDGHGDDHGHGLSHVASTKVLLGTFGALMVLTIMTVAATMVDLGSSMNLLVAMIVATIKAGLVCMFFMHLRYDKVMHTVAFLAALLFALLFVSFALMDSSEYQQDIVWVEEAVQ